MDATKPKETPKDKKEKIVKKEEEDDEEEEEEEEEEEINDEIGEDFSKDPRAFTFTADAGKIAEGNFYHNKIYN